MGIGRGAGGGGGAHAGAGAGGGGPRGGGGGGRIFRIQLSPTIAALLSGVYHRLMIHCLFTFVRFLPVLVPCLLQLTALFETGRTWAGIVALVPLLSQLCLNIVGDVRLSSVVVAKEVESSSR